MAGRPTGGCVCPGRLHGRARFRVRRLSPACGRSTARVEDPGEMAGRLGARLIVRMDDGQVSPRMVTGLTPDARLAGHQIATRPARPSRAQATRSAQTSNAGTPYKRL